MNAQCLPHVYRTLLDSGLGRWILPLMQLLYRYEGMERALEPEQLPLPYLEQALAQIDRKPFSHREQLFFDALASLPILFFRASSMSSNWHPGHEPFLTFEKRVGKAVIWQAWTPQLTKQDIVKWMHTTQIESHHVWHSA
ncbi:MAG: hypothetical protein ABW157_15295 [Candidatus Thiodiazotropha sp. LLP2]|nr:hypothetical protein [Candidatus Thiodiazotropha lotti]MCG8011132.1 hypothetical protein [Candidatus Thiodiazotropha lotti]MCW4210595.1 hypothetical protein [Candidatus Thiodiazotropha lotti]MCW4216816.1 hypothetical protein [Candidatus Thiodiazotropha lotti]